MHCILENPTGGQVMSIEENNSRDHEFYLAVKIFYHPYSQPNVIIITVLRKCFYYINNKPKFQEIHTSSQENFYQLAPQHETKRKITLGPRAYCSRSKEIRKNPYYISSLDKQEQKPIFLTKVVPIFYRILPFCQLKSEGKNCERTILNIIHAFYCYLIERKINLQDLS